MNFYDFTKKGLSSADIAALDETLQIARVPVLADFVGNIIFIKDTTTGSLYRVMNGSVVNVSDVISSKIPKLSTVTANAIARWDSTTKELKDSGVTVDDGGNVATTGSYNSTKASGLIATYGDESFVTKYVAWRAGAAGMEAGLNTAVGTSGSLTMKAGQSKGFGVAVNSTKTYTDLTTADMNFFVDSNGRTNVKSPASGTALAVGRVGGQNSIQAGADANGGFMAISGYGTGAVILNHYATGDVWIASGGGKVGIGGAVTSSVPERVQLRADTKVVGNMNMTGTAKTGRGGYAGTYNSYQVQGIWSIDTPFKVDTVANDFGNQYGMAFGHTNAGTTTTRFSKKPYAGWGHQINFTAGGIANARISMSTGAGMFKGGIVAGDSVYSPLIKYKKLTGTTASTEGGNVVIAHGVDGAKILSVSGLIQYSTPGNTVVLGFSRPDNLFNSSFYTSQTAITVTNNTGQSASILSKPITILITYEA